MHAVASAADVRDWLIAVGTVGAVVVALGLASRQEWLARNRRPALSLTYAASSGVVTEDVRYEITVGSDTIVTTGTAAFLRLAVSNEAGKEAAEDVEVLLTQIREPHFGEETEIVDISFPGFGWTHAGTTRLTVPPGVTRYVDVARVHDNPPIEAALDFAGKVELLVNPQPINGRHLLVRGTYELVLTVSARNADAHDYVLRFSFNPALSGRDALNVIDPPYRCDNWQDVLG